jgi:hypothetical protein
VSCGKSEQTQAENNSSMANLTNEPQEEYVSVLDCLESKCPTTWDKCAAYCLFATVCICWDPKVLEGTCGCYFGIAKVGIRQIQKQTASNSGNGSPMIYHYINARVNSIRFNEYLIFLDKENINTQQLKSSFEKLLQHTIKKDNQGTIMVDQEEYKKFLEEYERFFGALNTNKKDKVLTYIKKKSIEAGIH